MKNSLFLKFTLVLALVLTFSCTNQINADYLPPIKINVPELLLESPQAIVFIDQNTEILNQWSIVLEDLVIDCERYMNNDDHELTSEEREKLGQNMMEFVAKLGQFAVTCSEMEQNKTMIESTLDNDQIVAFALVWQELNLRIQELNNRYQDYGQEEA